MGIQSCSMHLHILLLHLILKNYNTLIILGAYLTKSIILFLWCNFCTCLAIIYFLFCLLYNLHSFLAVIYLVFLSFIQFISLLLKSFFKNFYTTYEACLAINYITFLTLSSFFVIVCFVSLLLIHFRILFNNCLHRFPISINIIIIYFTISVIILCLLLQLFCKILSVVKGIIS